MYNIKEIYKIHDALELFFIMNSKKTERFFYCSFVVFCNHFVAFFTYAERISNDSEKLFVLKGFLTHCEIRTNNIVFEIMINEPCN